MVMDLESIRFHSWLPVGSIAPIIILMSRFEEFAEIVVLLLHPAEFKPFFFCTTFLLIGLWGCIWSFEKKGKISMRGPQFYFLQFQTEHPFGRPQCCNLKGGHHLDSDVNTTGRLRVLLGKGGDQTSREELNVQHLWDIAVAIAACLSIYLKNIYISRTNCRLLLSFL